MKVGVLSYRNRCCRNVLQKRLVFRLCCEEVRVERVTCVCVRDDAFYQVIVVGTLCGTWCILATCCGRVDLGVTYRFERMVLLNLTCSSRCTIGTYIGRSDGSTNQGRRWEVRRNVTTVPRILLARPTVTTKLYGSSRSRVVCQIGLSEWSSRCNIVL